jgi:hypothetical protein
MYDIKHCFICLPSDSTLTENAGIDFRTTATTALAVRRSNHSARSHPPSAISHPHTARSHPSESLPMVITTCQRGLLAEEEGHRLNVELDLQSLFGLHVT